MNEKYVRKKEKGRGEGKKGEESKRDQPNTAVIEYNVKQTVLVLRISELILFGSSYWSQET